MMISIGVSLTTTPPKKGMKCYLLCNCPPFPVVRSVLF